METSTEKLAYINEHRIACNHEPFVQLTDDEIEQHLVLIDENSPWGNDPWHSLDS